MKTFNTVMNIIIGSGIGVFIGMSIYRCYDYFAHPDLYEMTSAPWYTGILLHGILTAAFLAVCVVIKVIIKQKKQK